MLIHEIHIFELRIETNFQCMNLVEQYTNSDIFIFRYSHDAVVVTFQYLFTLKSENVRDKESGTKLWISRPQPPPSLAQSLLLLVIRYEYWYIGPGTRFSKDPKFSGWHNSPCNFKTNVFRVTKLRSYLNFYSLYNIIMKRTALQNKRVGVLRMAFRARKVFGCFEKRTPGLFGM